MSDEQKPQMDTSIIREMMAHWIPFPDAAYWKKFGIEPNPDGTIDTPGGFRIPTREMCEKIGYRTLR
jgi:hypothetical protein